uniref:Uncharacterized protein n=1 Tax=Peronospora matthiolae TaxID=2874970 RepID=A0AAV1TZR4_9STRA
MIVWRASFLLPPPPLEDSRGGQRHLVEQLLNHRDVNGRRTSYLRPVARLIPRPGILGSPRSQLMVDVLGLVEQYDDGTSCAAEGTAGESLPGTVVKDFRLSIPSYISVETRTRHHGLVRR